MRLAADHLVTAWIAFSDVDEVNDVLHAGIDAFCTEFDVFYAAVDQFCTENDELCTEFDAFHAEIDEMCTEIHVFHVEIDEFCTENDRLSRAQVRWNSQSALTSCRSFLY